MTEISHLPAETLECIFSFLNGKSLCQSEKVCQSWHQVIYTMKKNNSHWRRICRNEIPESVLEEVLYFKPIPSEDFQVIDWKTIYKKWFLGRMIKSWPHSKKHVQVFEANPVICVKHSGSYIITGHSNGLLCIWNQLSGQLIQKGLYHLKTITDMALVDLLNLGFYGPIDMSWAHHHLISISKDSVIRVSSLLSDKQGPTIDEFNTVHHHSDSLETIKVFGDCFAVQCRDNTVTTWIMELKKSPCYEMKISLLQYIIGPLDLLRSVGFWHGEVHCVTYSGKLKHWKSSDQSWVEIKSFHDTSSTTNENIISVTSAFLFRNNIVILLTANAHMVISIGTQTQHRCYHLMKTLRSLIVSISLFGTILALGTENGKLLLYHIPQTSHMLELALEQPALSLVLSEASITAVNISDCGDSPVIVACTTESLFIIKWYPPSRNCQVIRGRDLSSLFGSCSS